MPLFVGILVLLILGLLAFSVPAADVTVTLPSHSFSLPMRLTATANSHQDVAHKTLPAQTLSSTFFATGPGHATGTTLVGTKAATGIVTFTNTGSSDIVIPTGTIVATQSGVQFMTTAETLVSAPPNNTNIAPILARKNGSGGNVPANAITSIPSSSNPGLNTSALTVTNPNPTNGGGAGSATSVSASDVNAEKAALDPQLQAQVKEFLKKNVHTGDQQGKPIETETPIAKPAVGEVATDGTFTLTLNLKMKVLVVRAADLQAAATAQLKAALSKQGTSLALVPQQNVEVKQVKSLPSKDGTSLAISFTAVGQAAPQISEDMVRGLISGKSINEAKLALVGKGGIPNAVDPQITVYPSFIPWLPFWQSRIHVHFKTMPVKQAPLPKHGKS